MFGIIRKVFSKKTPTRQKCRRDLSEVFLNLVVTRLINDALAVSKDPKVRPSGKHNRRVTFYYQRIWPEVFGQERPEIPELFRTIKQRLDDHYNALDKVENFPSQRY